MTLNQWNDSIKFVTIKAATWLKIQKRPGSHKTYNRVFTLNHTHRDKNGTATEVNPSPKLPSVQT